MTNIKSRDHYIVIFHGYKLVISAYEQIYFRNLVKIIELSS